MNPQQILSEAHSSILYHYSSLYNASEILRSGKFHLSSTSGNPSEKAYAPEGYPYFLSTSRTRVGDYSRFVSNSGVMFVLDGTRISAHYPVRPIDYWERAWLHSNGSRSRESEDRIFSKKSTMPLSIISEIHLLLKEPEVNRGQSARARQLMIDSKKRNIPIYLYKDEKAWRFQDTRKAVPPSEAKELLSGAQRLPYQVKPLRGVKGYGRSSILDWIELIRKPTTQPLTKNAEKLLYDVKYAFGARDTARIENDLFNAKKPTDTEYTLSVKLTDYLTRNNLSISDLIKMLKHKWKKE